MKRIAVFGNAGAWSSERLADAIERRTGFRCLLELPRLSVDLERGVVLHRGEPLPDLDAVVVKKVARSYGANDLDRLEGVRYLEHAGVRAFSSAESLLRVLNRLSCTVTLRLNGIPMPPTLITEDAEVAFTALEEYGRAVLKPLFSTKARGMEVVTSGDQARDAIARFQSHGNRTIYLQKLMALPGRDLGLVFVGGTFVAAYARVGDGGSWHTTTHAGGRYEVAEPEPSIVELAARAQAPFGLDFTCVDVVESEVGPLVLEVSALGGFRGLYESQDLEVADLIADHVLKETGNGRN